MRRLLFDALTAELKLDLFDQFFDFPEEVLKLVVRTLDGLQLVLQCRDELPGGRVTDIAGHIVWRVQQANGRVLEPLHLVHVSDLLLAFLLESRLRPALLAHHFGLLGRDLALVLWLLVARVGHCLRRKVDSARGLVIDNGVAALVRRGHAAGTVEGHQGGSVAALDLQGGYPFHEHLRLLGCLSLLTANGRGQAEILFAPPLHSFFVELLGRVGMRELEPRLQDADEPVTARQLEDLRENVVPALVLLHLIEDAALSRVLLELDVPEDL